MEQDSLVSLLADNEAAIRAFEASPAGWRNRHLRMRAHAGRERIAANLLKVSHLPGEYQVADLGTKPLVSARIMRLLELINIRGKRGLEGSTSDARLLSRLCLEGSPSVDNLAKTLAGLALLAMLPRVQGQPIEDQVGIVFSWGSWVLGWLVVVAAGIGGWWYLSSWGAVMTEEAGEEVAEGFGVLAECSEVSSGVPQASVDVPSTAGGSADPLPVVPPETSGQCRDEVDPADDVFTDAEWEVAASKLAAAELATGLTLVQRARIRRALESGGILDPPTFLQRYGPAPAWVTGRDDPIVTGGASSGRESGFSSSPVEGSQVLMEILSLQGERLAEWLGIQTVVWQALSVASRVFQGKVGFV